MIKTMLLAGLMMLASIAILAQKSEIFNTTDGAINGYDPVAYFTEARPVKGNRSFTYLWRGSNWYFTSQQHLDTFKFNPEKFSPQYGGYCAYGMADGHKAPTEPDAWTIVQDKLFLNYNKTVKALWIKQQDEFINTADANWPLIKDRE